MIKIVLGLLLASVALALPLSAQTSAKAGTPVRAAGQILATRVRGSVSVTDTSTGVTSVLHDGDKLTEKHTVTTAKGGAVILIFSNGATVSMSEESVLNIEEFQQDPFGGPVKISDLKKEPTTSITKLNMTRGDIVGKVVHLNIDGGSEFTVVTPVGAAGIRGTTFEIVFIPDGNGNATFAIRTADGRVVFGTIALPVPVPAGQQISGTIQVTSNANGSVTPNSTPTAATMTTQNIPTADLATITAAAQAIVDTVTNTTVTLTTTNTTTTTSTQGGTTTTTVTTTTATADPSAPVPVPRLLTTLDGTIPTPSPNPTPTGQ